MLRAISVLDEYDQTVIDLEEGIENEQAGRTRTSAEADADLRRQLGFAS
ncbi:MAG: hypothetical protein IT424_06515 [Pirellulales bacterium]|nr:hypothetical protein [Pirellulales bacterium]